MPAPRRRLQAGPDTLRAGFTEIRSEHEVPIDFQPAALAEARSGTQDGAATSGAVRSDLTDVPFITLDPPGSTDLDQAMHLSRSGTGYVVRYAIADTAAFVAPGGALDRATHQRVETVYCPDLRVPLHPEVLSEGAASLLPGDERPAVAWTFELDDRGQVTDVTVERAVVRSRAQLDYPAEQRRLDAGVDRDDLLTLLVEIGTRRAALERERGGVSLGRPEQVVVDGRLDAHGGHAWRLEYRAALPIEDHNAQISLMTGMAAAQLMLDARIGVLRTMPTAGADDLARLRRQAGALGVPWPKGQSYRDVLAGIDHSRPETAAFLAAATTLFRGAAWTPFRGTPPDQPEHGAIAAPYAHVTAPLRRLVDRYGLEISLAAHAGRPVPEWVEAALPTLGDEMAMGARRGAAVDRACTDLVEAAVLAGRVGEVFEAVAIDDRTVQLREPAVVGRCEGPDLTPGTALPVRLVTADPATRMVRFRPES